MKYGESYEIGPLLVLLSLILLGLNYLYKYITINFMLFYLKTKTEASTL